ncbi:hypothetical protein [Herbaspirillum frisingense]|uniref:ATP-binding protein n=1 Tax=Herbaspirillum frisingense TaxID=92645 RepID=A0ABU1PLJ0_9BURK|nr:hypothetical protein [Herbaspirillum frisingense]MDR6586352.1 hypothetical protein [Herbaspirillum frisingense]
MAQSPELAGGAGFTFEGYVAAFYMSALLADARVPGIENRSVRMVSVQQRDFGEPLDDVVVDFEEVGGAGARLSLQVKRSLTISDGKTNTDFRDIMRDSWATLNSQSFRVGNDRYGAAVGEITSVSKERDFRTLCEWARESVTTDHFEQRFAEQGNASEAIRQVRSIVHTVLAEVRNEQITPAEMHRFLAHFVLIRFDFLTEGATSPSEAINRIADCLISDERTKAQLVWAYLVQLARGSAGAAGQFDRPRLVRGISELAKLIGSRSFQGDLQKLHDLAVSYTLLIQDDVGGTKLDRPALEEMLEKESPARFLEVRGLPGSGKSVLLKRAVLRHLDRGSVLFLKAEQLEGLNWIGFARANGISATSLVELLVEIGATGTPILFIDAIDRIATRQQPIVIDILNTIQRNSTLLGNWRVIASLRDTSVELLRNWLGPYTAYLGVQTLEVNLLNDEEADFLARDKPYLRPLLFGTDNVKQIVRRPFFTKILNQSIHSGSGQSDFAPQSEIDLIENWWRRGGYDADPQAAMERQRLLIELARARARNLSQHIANRDLTQISRLGELIDDGIVQHGRAGVSVQFAHDIFFEWAFFYALAEQEHDWMVEIKNCGEPPAVARVVELVAQWEFTNGSNWRQYLAATNVLGVRSQWQRAWLLGPLGNSHFAEHSEQFKTVAFDNDYQFLGKALVWFQAEKTIPNAGILAQKLPNDERQRIADALGQPSDYETWIRFLIFLIKHASKIPKRLYPDVVSIFEVWQNSFANYSNPVSRSLLRLCSQWWVELAKFGRYGDPKSEGDWQQVRERRVFRESLRNLIFRSALSEPELVKDFLQQAATSEISDEIFDGVAAFSLILSKACPIELVDFALRSLKRELPQEKHEKEESAARVERARRSAIQEKPEGKRTKSEKAFLANWYSAINRSRYDLFDWRHLALADDHRTYSPPSPIREPFNALFLNAPEEALRLLRELCNHATTAWRQLHTLSSKNLGVPLPLRIAFPWGTQEFWGTSGTYIWFRSMGAPEVLGSGFMALEDWCFAELERGAEADTLIKKIVFDNTSIAVLGVAAALALHTETTSDVSLALVSSQRLLMADEYRFKQDFQSIANLMGFTGKRDQPHIDAIKRANDRIIRRKYLSLLIPNFMFASDSYRERIQQRIQDFPNSLEFEYSEEENSLDARSQLLSKAAEYDELVQIENYHAYQHPEDAAKIGIVHVSPSAGEAENVSKREEAVRYLRESGLQSWAARYFETGELSGSYTIDAAIAVAKQIDRDIFSPDAVASIDQTRGSALRGALAATAAVVLVCRDTISDASLDWARDVLWTAIKFPIDGDLSSVSTAVVPWHYAISVARGLAADYLYDTARDGTPVALLSLLTHPLEMVSVAAFKEILGLWKKDPRLSWSGIYLAMSMCKVARGKDRDLHPSMLHDIDVMNAKLQEAIQVHDDHEEWSPLPALPDPWIKLEPDVNHINVPRKIVSDEATGEDVHWGHPNEWWHSSLAAKFLLLIPYNEVLKSDGKEQITSFMAASLKWTFMKMSPPWEDSRDRDRSDPEIYEWVRGLGRSLGIVLGEIPLAQARERFLFPVLQLGDTKCWELLAPLTDSLTRKHLYDAPVLSDNVLSLLDECLARFLNAPEFDESGYRRGEMHGIEQRQLLRTFLFVEIEHAGLACRYVNGDWSEISRIVPLVERIIRKAGWSAEVTSEFLTLCERARQHYPVEKFADQILANLRHEKRPLSGWSGTFLTARIAGLVQYFSGASAPMRMELAQKFLAILDILVDMGDRRSAALQLSEAFREIRLTSN